MLVVVKKSGREFSEPEVRRAGRFGNRAETGRGGLDERAHPLVLGDPERHPPPGSPSRRGCRRRQTDLVHEHLPGSARPAGSAAEGAQDSKSRGNLADAPVRQEPELGSEPWRPGRRRPEGSGPPRRLRAALKPAGGGVAGVLASARRGSAPAGARRLGSPGPSERSPPAPPPAPASQSARGGGRGPRASCRRRRAVPGRGGIGLRRPGEGTRQGAGGRGSPSDRPRR